MAIAGGPLGFGLTGPIYNSTNSGATWTQTGAPVTSWSSVASSADGTKLAGTDQRVIYTSKDAGATWTPVFTNIAASPVTGLSSISSSADGSVLVAGDASSDFNILTKLYTSTDSGATWNTTTPGFIASVSVASSADGTKLIAAFQTLIYRSTNSGATWTAIRVNGEFTSVASSADGTKLEAGTINNGTYTSTDSGATWSPDMEPITSRTFVASSADGGKLIALVNGGGIWVSQTVPTPSLRITASISNLVVAWTVPSMNFTLQQNSDLTTTSWTDVASKPVLDFGNLQYQVAVPVTGNQRLYRLQH